MIKGLAYTPFALLAASILVAMAFGSLQNFETQQFNPQATNSVKQSIYQTQEEYTEDSLKVFLNHESGTHSSQDIEKALNNLAVNGTYNGVNYRNHTIKNLSKKVQGQSERIEELNLTEVNTSIKNLSLQTSMEVKISLEGRKRTFNSFNKFAPYIEDPLLKGTPHSRNITACSFDALAVKLYDGLYSSGTVRAKAEVQPKPGSATPSDDEILVVQNISQYNTADTQNFAGYFSQKTPTSPSNYNNNYTTGTSSLPSLEEDQMVIIHQGFWKSNFQNALSQECYMPVSNTQTPSLVDRINEDTRGSSEKGMYTVLSNTSALDSEIGYERIDSAGLTMTGIETITETGAYPNFSMSEDLTQATGIGDLAK